MQKVVQFKGKSRRRAAQIATETINDAQASQLTGPCTSPKGLMWIKVYACMQCIVYTARVVKSNADAEAVSVGYASGPSYISW